MKKLLAVIFLGFFLSGVSHAIFHKEEWDGWVYPDANDLTSYISVGTSFASLKDCRAACLKKISNAGYQNADYEYGLNCKPSFPGADTFICKETSR